MSIIWIRQSDSSEESTVVVSTDLDKIRKGERRGLSDSSILNLASANEAPFFCYQYTFRDAFIGRSYILCLSHLSLLIAVSYTLPLEFLSMKTETKFIDQNIHSRLSQEYRLENLCFYIVLKHLFHFLAVHNAVG